MMLKGQWSAFVLYEGPGKVWTKDVAIQSLSDIDTEWSEKIENKTELPPPPPSHQHYYSKQSH